MKKAFTLLVILFVFQKQYSSAFSTDTIKVTRKDSLKIASIKKDTAQFDLNHFLDSLKKEVKLKGPDTLTYSGNLTAAKHLKSTSNINPNDDLVQNGVQLPVTSAITSSEEKSTFVYVNHGSNNLLLAMLSDSVKTSAFINVSDSLSIALKRADSLRAVQYAFIENAKQRIKFMGLDSLKLTLRFNKYESLKGPIYTEIADRYMQYDSISNKETRLNYQNEAIDYTMLALHQYSKRNDSIGLRICFDNLAKVYFAKKNYSQAKWFILQSNTLSRVMNDVPNIITSLVTLAAIKSDIKDYALAMKDLTEAMQLSINHHYPKLEMDVLKNFGFLYSRLKNFPKAEMALKKRDSIEASIKKSEEAALIAKVAQDSLQKKKIDFSLNKKKVLTSGYKKPSKSSSAKKTASL
jgi:tetratricopeptide (TPR) repeat protein